LKALKFEVWVALIR